MELSELNIGRAVLDFALDDVKVQILLRDEPTLLHEPLVLFVELGVDLSQDCGVLVGGKLLLAGLHLLELVIESLLLFLAFLLQLRLFLGERGLFFNHSLDDHDLVLLDIAFVYLLLKLLLFFSDLVDLLLVLLTLVLELSDLFLDSGG